MCIIERKTYIYPGEERTVETPRRCPRASGSRLCNRVDYKSVQPVRVVEASPSKDFNNSSDGVIVTEGRDGRHRVYRDLSKRSSNSSSIRRSNTMSDRSPISTPSSASSPSHVEVKPEAPTPPPAAPGFPFPERTRMPYPPPLSPLDPGMIVTPDGTAVYDRPPSLDSPRAVDNERPRTSHADRRSSVSSTTAEVDDSVEPGPSRPKYRGPGISIDTTFRPSTSSSSLSFESPGLSNLLRVSSLRRDSVRETPRRDSRRKPERRRTDSDHQHCQSRAEEDRRRRQDEEEEEEERQARIERGRLAESDRRQSARVEMAREASRERHRQETAAALEGSQRDFLEEDPIELQREAELAQMARERAATTARQRDSDQAQRHADDQLRSDADAHAQYYGARDLGSPRASLPRRTTRDSYTFVPSPTLSARSPFSGTGQPVIHQHISARSRDSQTIRERGEEVIAREQARAATERLGSALRGMSMDDPIYDDEYELVDEYYVGEGQDRRRRRRRDGERERRQQQFWR